MVCRVLNPLKVYLILETKMGKKYHKSRYDNDYIDTVHFNMDGRKLCNIIVMNPSHSTVESEVTCRNCRKRMRAFTIRKKLTVKALSLEYQPQ